MLDAVVLPSPYALSFGGFVNLPTSLWFGAGGVVGSLSTARAPARRALPPDMSGTSLFGGGLIAGDALAALGIGIAKLESRRRSRLGAVAAIKRGTGLCAARHHAGVRRSR